MDVTSAHILLRFARLLVGDTGSPRVRGTMQALFVMESGENGSADVLGILGKLWKSGESRTQLVTETAHRVSEVLSPRLVSAATQSTGPLYNKIRDELGKGLDLLTIEKIFL
jgi:hypothetical protein